MTPDYDVVVLGAGPAGVAAAVSAAKQGARVCVIELDKLGGNCVNTSCIPTQILLDVANKVLEIDALVAVGVVKEGGELRYGPLLSRKDSFVERMAGGIQLLLGQAGVAQSFGAAAFVDSHTVRLVAPDGTECMVSSEAFVIATGTIWEPPAVRGLPAGTVSTPDALLASGTLPSSVVILGDGPADFPFAVEYAFFLAAAGVDTSLVIEGQEIVPGLDREFDHVVVEMLDDLGCGVFLRGSVTAHDGSGVQLHSPGRELQCEPDLIIAADCRRPSVDVLELDRAGVEFERGIKVDDQGRTTCSHIFAAGDVTGQWWHTAAAQRVGEIVGRNAFGASETVSVRSVPRILHTYPEIAWVGLTEERARHEDVEVKVGYSDLAWNAKAIVRGGAGSLKVIVGPLGELLGVHAVGAGAAEMVTVAAAFMQAEAVADEVAAFLPWHPSASEALVEAVRSAVR